MAKAIDANHADLGSIGTLFVTHRGERTGGIVEEFLAAAKKLTRAPDQFGYGVRHTMDQEAGWWYEASFWVIGFGGRWAVAGKPTVNSPPVVAAVRFFKQLYDAGIFPKGVDSATYRRMFYHEKVAMLTDNQNHIVISRTQNPAIEVEAVSPPFNPPVTHAEPVFLTIPKAARHPKEAAAFVEFFQRHLKEYGLAARNIVNSRSANEAILKESPHLRTFVELAVVPDAILPAGFETRLPELRRSWKRSWSRSRNRTPKSWCREDCSGGPGRHRLAPRSAGDPWSGGRPCSRTC